MLKITETEPYYILPTQRYDLTTRPPSKSMQGDYTLFISFKVDDLIKTSTPCGIMMRPGMHYGLCYTQEANSINYEFWYEEDGENKFGFCTISLPDSYPTNSLHDVWFCIVNHNIDSKQFTLKLYNEDNEFVEHTANYKGKLINYSGTPYNFGCGNYFKQVDDTHYFFGDYTLFNVGLIETTKYSDEEIQKFIASNKNSFEVCEAQDKLDELVFYFNFKNQSLYKTWDLSNHCNFLMKNMDVFK